MSAAGSRSPSGNAYRVGDLVVDVGRQRVTRGDTEISLSGLSFELLLALVREAPNLVTYDRLMSLVWPKLVVSPETVTQRVKLVRDALGDDPHAPVYILGVRGRGYRLLAPVEPIVPPSEPHAATAEPADAPRDAEASSSPRRRVAALAAALAIATVALGGGLWWWAAQADPSRTVVVQPERTIAVLPLIDISPGGGNEYLGDGLAEELAYRLATVPGLRVASSTSAFAFKGRTSDIKRIGQSLGVRHVLEGSVRRDRDRLRVHATLVDATSGFSVWTQKYDREWHDLLVIHDELAQAIARRLELMLTEEAAKRLARQPTADLAAFDRYLVGRARLRQPTSAETLAEAEAAFRDALASDARFARAHAGLCETYTIRYELGRAPDVAAEAESACRQALALDGAALEVEAALARLYVASGRSERAVQIFTRSVTRDPGNADAHIGLARAYQARNRLAEAEATFRRAVEVEPSYWHARSALGNFLLQHGRVDEAESQYELITHIAPASALGFNSLGAARQMSGDYAGAAEAFERSLELEPTSSAHSNTGTMYFYLGRFGEAADKYRRAAELTPEDHRVWGNLADAQAHTRGGREAALESYRRAIALAERTLAVNPEDIVTQAQLAWYFARTGERALATKLAADAVASRPDIVWVQYYAALVALEHDDASAALEALERALELGYPRRLVQDGPEFSKLRRDGRFDRLLTAAANAGGGKQ